MQHSHAAILMGLHTPSFYMLFVAPIRLGCLGALTSPALPPSPHHAHSPRRPLVRSIYCADAPALKAGNSAHIEDNLRKNYIAWREGLIKPGGLADGAPAPYRFLVGVTKRLNIDRWEKYTVHLLLRQKEKLLAIEDSRLVEGEVSAYRQNRITHAE